MNILNLFVDTQRIKNMTRGYWLINFNRSEVRRFTEERANEDQFNKYVFIDNEKIISVQVKNRGYLKVEKNLRQKKPEIYGRDLLLRDGVELTFQIKKKNNLFQL